MRLGQATPQGVAIALPLLTQDPRAGGLGAYGGPVARVVVDDDNLVDGFEAAEITHGRGDPGLLIKSGEDDRDAVALPHRTPLWRPALSYRRVRPSDQSGREFHRWGSSAGC